jgi:hypothetical protein
MPLPPLALRRALNAHRPGRGKLYAREVQSAVVEFAQDRRRAGASWKQIAAELGLRFETVRRWCVSARPERALKRVEVVDDVGGEAGGLRIVCPSGHRLEGLTLQDAIAVLRALA